MTDAPPITDEEIEYAACLTRTEQCEASHYLRGALARIEQDRVEIERLREDIKTWELFEVEINVAHAKCNARLTTERDQLKTRCEDLTRQLVDADLCHLADESDLVHLRATCDSLRSECGRLRELLIKVEWGNGTSTGYCPWCRACGFDGHLPSCQLRAALDCKG